MVKSLWLFGAFFGEYGEYGYYGEAGYKPQYTQFTQYTQSPQQKATPFINLRAPRTTLFTFPFSVFSFQFFLLSLRD